MKTCPNCSNEVEDNESMCPCCGEMLEQETAKKMKPVSDGDEQETTKKMKPVSDDAEQETARKMKPVSDEGDKGTAKKATKTATKAGTKTSGGAGTTKYKKKGSGKKKISYGSSKTSKLPIIIGIIAVVIIIAVVVVMFILPKTNDTDKSTDKNTSKTAEQTTSGDITSNIPALNAGSEQGTDSKEQEETVKAEVTESSLAVLDYIITDAASASEVGDYKEALLKICDFAEEYNAGSEVTERMGDIYLNYKDLVLSSLTNLNSQEESPALYIQMNMDLGEAYELSERLVNAGVEIDDSDLKDLKDALDTEYKQRLCDHFDRKASETMSQNGVISRSVLWAAMEKCDETGLFEEGDVSDPLNIRYMTALALKTDSEVESLDMAQAVLKLYEMLEETDYSPLLIYYLAKNYGDTQAQEWLTYIDTVIPGFSSYDLGKMRNYMITYVNETEKRDMIRTYMQSHYNPN